MTITCGIDWAEGHHDVALVNAEGERVAKLRIDTGLTGFTELMTLLAEHTDDPAGVSVAIETDKVLIVTALRAGGLDVYAINPRAVARYRERWGQAGGKSDRGDALVLANVLRTDRHLHRRLPAISEVGRAVKVLARQHQEAIWVRQATVLAAAPTPADAARLTRARMIVLLRRAGRRNDPGLAERILTQLHVPALRQPPPVEAGYGRAVAALLAVVTVMQTGIADLETAMATEFDQHPTAELLRSIPGLGPILAARVLAEIGDDTTRFATAQNLRAFAGTAPITKASGKSTVVRARHIRNRRLGDACHWWAFASITKSAGARTHYDQRRAAGDSHNAALRNLANKLLGRLWWCHTNNQPWREDAAWPQTTTAQQTAA